jgi:quercetin dioxygenase-like cupin family protein
MSEPLVYIDVADNVAVRMMHFQEVGDTHDGHIHNFNHLSLLSKGSVRVEFNSGVAEYSAPCIIIVPKLVRHLFIATEAGTVMSCVHAVRDGTGVEDVAPQGLEESQAIELLHRFPILVSGG